MLTSIFVLELDSACQNTWQKMEPTTFFILYACVITTSSFKQSTLKKRTHVAWRCTFPLVRLCRARLAFTTDIISRFIHYFTGLATGLCTTTTLDTALQETLYEYKFFLYEYRWRDTSLRGCIYETARARRRCSPILAALSFYLPSPREIRRAP